MQTVIYILGVIIALITVFLIIKQVKIAKRQTEMAELKASLPPEFKSIPVSGDGHGGLEFNYTIVGRADIPIKLQKITLKVWDRNNSENIYLFIEQILSSELAKDKEFREKLHCPRDRFKSYKTENVEYSGECCLYYLDFNSNLKRSCIEPKKFKFMLQRIVEIINKIKEEK